MSKKDNILLVEFEFLIDLDLAMYTYIRDKYYESPYVDQKFIRESKEYNVVEKLLSRRHINPLEIIIPGMETTKMYYEILKDEETLLSYAKAYDTFGLMITYLNNASSVDITVLCKNQLEADYIKNLNDRLKTLVSSKRNINMNTYDGFFLKNFVNICEYPQPVRGKHLFIPLAGWNMSEKPINGNDVVNMHLIGLYGDVNLIHLIDLYTNVKYAMRKKEPT